MKKQVEAASMILRSGDSDGVVAVDSDELVGVRFEQDLDTLDRIGVAGIHQGRPPAVVLPVHVGTLRDHVLQKFLCFHNSGGRAKLQRVLPCVVEAVSVHFISKTNFVDTLVNVTCCCQKGVVALCNMSAIAPSIIAMQWMRQYTFADSGRTQIESSSNVSDCKPCRRQATRGRTGSAL